MIAADSLSPWRTRASGSAFGMRRTISWRMIAGIIWNVDALPTPVTKNRNRKLPKKPQNALG